MKEIKAYVRRRKLDDVIQALRREGVPGITVSQVHGVGYGYEANDFTLSPSEMRRIPKIAKLEVVCPARTADRVVEVIVTAARTGSAGDGIVFVTPVLRAVKIRNGVDGPMALETEEPS